MLPWHQYLLGAILIIIGVFHLQRPKIFIKIIPPYLPYPKNLVLWSGILEMIFGFMLLNIDTQKTAAIAIIIMLVVYLPVHFYMLSNDKASLGLPKWVLILRIPLQLVIMYWAYQYV